jgi:hypothetical protein
MHKQTVVVQFDEIPRHVPASTEKNYVPKASVRITMGLPNSKQGRYLLENGVHST